VSPSNRCRVKRSKSVNRAARNSSCLAPRLPHQIFADLFGQQSYANAITSAVKREALAQVIHELTLQKKDRRADLWRPTRWLRLAFERLIGFPRYLLETAGFSPRVTESGFARVVTVLWSIALGLATIGGFVVGLIALIQSQ
jgi:hypothetical protein